MAQEIGSNLHHYTVIADKSTVPVGTAERVHNVIARELQSDLTQIEANMASDLAVERAQATYDIESQTVEHEHNMREIAASGRSDSDG